MDFSMIYSLVWKIVFAILKKEGLKLLGWREVPVRPQVLGQVHATFPGLSREQHLLGRKDSYIDFFCTFSHRHAPFFKLCCETGVTGAVPFRSAGNAGFGGRKALQIPCSLSLRISGRRTATGSDIEWDVIIRSDLPESVVLRR